MSPNSNSNSKAFLTLFLKFPDVISNTMGAIDAISLKSWQLLKDGSYTQDDRSVSFY